MIAAIVIGVATGIVGSLPLVLHRRIVRSRRKKGRETSVSFLIGLVIASLAIMSIAIVGCALVSRELVAPFALPMTGAFLICVVASSAVQLSRRGRKPNRRSRS